MSFIHSSFLCSRFYFVQIMEIPSQSKFSYVFLRFYFPENWTEEGNSLESTFHFSFSEKLSILLSTIRWNSFISAEQLEQEKDGSTLGRLCGINRGQREDRAPWPWFYFHHLWLEGSIRDGWHRGISKEVLHPSEVGQLFQKVSRLHKSHDSDPGKVCR